MWKLEAGERIARWREFRKSLDNLPFDQALTAVAEFWHGCPFNPYYLDPDDAEKWPSPWDLISENYYCDLAKALGMLYTIYFTCHGKTHDMEIRVYYDPESRLTYNLAIFDKGKYMLNFRDDEIVNIESINKNLALKYCYTSRDLKLEEY
jgi:hypothetical protein